ncbi:glycoside hydrolase family 127 protein [Echinicola sp. CAU 1574]|uniref:Glycoside hydrolase family 127 protein n=1 Tax=Echinicola arenosa TaxID=2774144 RepID=A0ABR9ARC4_9BACT|nr:beta-L-arabinofuranosidase domain-containing protein [Echinicola arenosa]MBD8491340.1 glycoside hydrolase family 127 protein [Echinicola arenosa]
MFKTSFLVRLVLIVSLFVSCSKTPITGTYEKNQSLPFGEIKPKGWIYNQISRDLDVGITGNFDKIGKTVNYELFVNSNRESDKKYDGLKCWWSGEHEGYWKDAVLRGALLTENPKYKKRAVEWMDAILSNIDDSGYIGIYGVDSRYNHKGENGELWTKSRILMPILAYYEYSKDEKVLEAVEKSVQLTISHYTEKTAWVKGQGGVSHGVGYFEVLEWLYRITQNTLYKDFSIKLYEDFCQAELSNDDLKTQKLINPLLKFKGHGAHVAEGFLMPQYMATLNPNDTLMFAAEQAIKKLNYHSTPGGAMLCAEAVNEKKGSANDYYEYCATTEFINPLGVIFSLTGDFSIADRIEKMTFNALQGGRLPDLKGLSYLTSENRMDISKNNHGGRETYDAYHKAAACCALNGGRVLPYYIQHMWKKNLSENKLVAALYGPSQLSTQLNDVQIQINEQTDYPFSDVIKFEMNNSKASTFDLVLRKPHGCNIIEVEGINKNEIQDYKDKIVISRKWEQKNVFSIKFNFEVEVKDINKDVYFQRGALVYAMPFEYKTDTLRQHNDTNFYQVRMSRIHSEDMNYSVNRNTEFKFSKTKNTNHDFPFDKPMVSLRGNILINNESNEMKTLIPLGNTVLRKVSFQVNNK